MNLRRYTQLKEKAERLQRDADKAQGALEQVKEQISKEFGCQTIKAAKALAEELQAELEQTEQKYEQQLTRFEKEWGDEIG